MQIARDVIMVAASAGGFAALRALLQAIPEDLPVVVGITLHRSDASTADLSDVLGWGLGIEVLQPNDGQLVQPGKAYLAPGGWHLRFSGGRICLGRDEKQHHCRPAADPMFVSAAAEFGKRVVGVVLSGEGHDGAAGLIEIKAQGGICLAQAPEEAKNPSMPLNAIVRDHVDAVLPIAELGPLIVRLARGETVIRESRQPVE